MKTQFILAAVLSLATVSAMAQPHHKKPAPQRADKVVVIKHYHQNHVRVAPRHQPRTTRVAPRHYRPTPSHKHYVVRPVPRPEKPQVYYAPPRPVLSRPVANLSLSVHL